MEDILGKYPRSRRLHRRPAASRSSCRTPIEKVAAKYKDKIASGALALVVADTLPVQIDLMKKGLSAGQVGQRPFEMGYKAMYFLKDIKDGKAAAGGPDLYRPRRLHAEERRHLRRRRQLIARAADFKSDAAQPPYPLFAHQIQPKSGVHFSV